MADKLIFLDEENLKYLTKSARSIYRKIYKVTNIIMLQKWLISFPARKNNEYLT